MRIAWFCPASSDAPLTAGEMAPLIPHLAAAHEIEVFQEARAHEFVWRHRRQPFDVCVYELRDTPAHDFIWPYVFHYPGVLCLGSRSLASSRMAALLGRHRGEDLTSELGFSGADMVRAPAVASRLVVVSDEYIAAALQDRLGEARIRSAPVATDTRAGNNDDRSLRSRTEAAPLRVAVVDGPTTSSIAGAVDRARVAGCEIDLIAGRTALESTHVVVSIPWPPPTGLSAGALAAMAAARAVVVLETEATASLPALDPQTWLPRDLQTGPPVVVSLDPRDEEHSLMIALRRLADDRSLGRDLGRAAAEWSRAHASPAAAARAWQALLEEAASLQPPERPASWPAHLSPDGTEVARQILDEFGVSLDV
jgi:hypothetical protein